MLVELSIEKFFLHLGSFQTAVGEKRYFFELGLVPFMGTTYIEKKSLDKADRWSV